MSVVGSSPGNWMSAPAQSLPPLSSSSLPCRPKRFIDRLPDEILSLILVIACEADEATFEDRLICPYIFNRISRRFYLITASTPGLWRYLLLKGSDNGQIWERVRRSGGLSLDMKVYAERDWAPRYEAILSSILPRLSRLSFNQVHPESYESIAQLFQQSMAELQELHIEGYSSTPLHLSASNFPRLRSVTSDGLIRWWSLESRLPETVEELTLRSFDAENAPDPVAKIRAFLPQYLQSLSLTIADAEDMVVGTSPVATIHLPHLTELRMESIQWEQELELIKQIEAPSLRRLSLYFDDGHYLERTFPLISVVQDFSSLTHLVTHMDSAYDIMDQFAADVAEKPEVIPYLEHLEIFGASPLNLRTLVKSHPTIKSLKVHALDLGLTADATRKEFNQLSKAVRYLESVVKLSLSLHSGLEFYPDSQERFRTWDDMINGRGIECDEDDFSDLDVGPLEGWYNWTVEQGTSRRRQ